MSGCAWPWPFDTSALKAHPQPRARHVYDAGPGTHFQAILGDDAAAANAATVDTVVLCSGKLYYDLVKQRWVANARPPHPGEGR